jgi:hypothetical protein
MKNKTGGRDSADIPLKHYTTHTTFACIPGMVRRIPLSFDARDSKALDYFLSRLRADTDKDLWRTVIRKYWNEGMTVYRIATQMQRSPTKIKETIRLIRYRDRLGFRERHAQVQPDQPKRKTGRPAKHAPPPDSIARIQYLPERVYVLQFSNGGKLALVAKNSPDAQKLALQLNANVVESYSLMDSKKVAVANLAAELKRMCRETGVSVQDVLR